MIPVVMTVNSLCQQVCLYYDLMIVQKSLVVERRQRSILYRRSHIALASVRLPPDGGIDLFELGAQNLSDITFDNGSHLVGQASHDRRITLQILPGT
jgi:hypothetical protein